MKRRQALGTIAGLCCTGGAVWVAQNGLSGASSTDGDRLPVRVETLEARGSAADERLVPVPGSVTVVDLFATWCGPCDDQVEILRDLHPEYDQVSFVSVTNERPSETLTRRDIADWWNRNDGAWTLGLDPGSELLTALGAAGLPYIAVTDQTGDVVFGHSGLTRADTLRAQLDTLL